MLRRPFGLTVVYALAFALVGWAIGLGRLRDNSLFWHLRTGELILDEGIPRADRYSFTAEGTRWVAQSWLAELTYGVLDRAFGPFALRVMAGSLGAAIGVFAFVLALRICGDRLRSAGLTLIVLAGFVLTFSARPLLIGLVLVLALVWAVELPDSWSGRHELIAVPVLLWLWVNVHGTWILGLGYLGVHLVGRWLEGARPWSGRERRVLMGGCIAAVVALLNPYGWRLVAFPFGLVGRGESLRRLREWSSPDIVTLLGIVLVVWFALLLIVFARRGASRRDVLVTITFMFLALWATRNAPLMLLVTLPIAARSVAVPQPVPGATLPSARVFAGVLSAVLAAVFIGTGVFASQQENFDFDRYPVDALDVVRGLDDGPVLTTDRTAGYVILTGWPDHRVFFDDRIDMYPPSVTDAYIILFDGEREWNEVLDRYGIAAVVWPVERPLAALLEASPEWTRVHEDERDGAWVHDPRYSKASSITDPESS